MPTVDAVFGAIALALWAAVWAMHPKVDGDKSNSKDTPLDPTPAHKGVQ